MNISLETEDRLVFPCVNNYPTEFVTEKLKIRGKQRTGDPSERTFF